MKGAVSQRRKTFAAAYRSDEDRQAYISASRRASSVIAKANAEAWQTTFSSFLLKSNPKFVYSLLCSVVGSSSSSSSSPNFPNCSSPRESASVDADYLRSYFSVSQPKTLRSRARGYLSELRRATCSEGVSLVLMLSFSPLNFLWLPSTSLRPLPLVQTKLPIAYYSTFLALAWIFFFTFSIFPGLCLPFPPSGRHLPLFPSTSFLPAYLSHLLRIKAV